MKAKTGLSVFIFLIGAVLCRAQETKLPIFFLNYDGGVGIEEDEDEEEEITATSHRHSSGLRIKEEFCDAFTANLKTVYTRKEYLTQSGSYWYFYVYPDLAFKLTEWLDWDLGYRIKPCFYDEPDSEGMVKDYINHLIKTEFSFNPAERLYFIPSVQAVYDIYRNEEKARQTYSMGLRINYKFDCFSIGGKYKSIIRNPLNEESLVDMSVNHEFGVSFSWDPNK